MKRRVRSPELTEGNPKRTQLYRHFDCNGVLLYVGVSLSALHRLSKHRKHAHWFNQIKRVEIEDFETREEALAAEGDAIVRRLKRHNGPPDEGDPFRRPFFPRERPGLGRRRLR